MNAIAQVELARLHAAAGAPVDPSGLPDRARRAVAVAVDVGAPIVPALDAVRMAMQDVAEQQRAIGVATAQGKVIAVGLMAAPIVLVPTLGAAGGVDVAAFYRTGPGVAVGVVALTLLAVGGVAILGLVKRAGRPRGPRLRPRGRALVGPIVAATMAAVLVHPIGGVVVAAVTLRARVDANHRGDVEEAAELMAIASAGGVGFGHMLRVAASHLPALDADLRRAALAIEIADEAHAPPDLERLVAVVRTARDLGAPIAGALRTWAAEARADQHARALAAAARLPAQLTVPTVLVLLPATLLLVGAPLVAGALSALPT